MLGIGAARKWPARILGPLVAGLVSLASTPLHAQGAGQQALRIIVPVAAGGTSDVVARLLAERLREQSGRTIVVENKAGATGRIAVDALKSAGADGNTLLLTPVVVPVILPLLSKDPGYVPARDLAAVGQVATYVFGLAVAPQHPAHSIPEFVRWAKANRAQASFGTQATGSLPHFVGVSIGQAAAVDLVHVPYKGISQIHAELMGGQLAAGISAVSDFAPLHRAGKLRLLAVSGAQRSPAFPDIPTFGEQGYDSIVAVGWHGLFAPGGTPEGVVAALSRALLDALAHTELRAKFLSLGLEPTGTTPRELAAIIAADTARWRPLIRAAGLAAD